jgi:hypothetical protein
VKEEGFEKFIDEAYTDDTLKEVAKSAGSYCAKKANKRAKGKQTNHFLKLKQ